MPQSAAIHGHPGAPLAASLPRHPRASHPHPGPSLPAAPRITPSHLANWSIPFASTHARNSPRAPDACLPGPRPWPAILRANVLWSESDSWGTPTGPPRPGDRLARPTGQWPFVAHEGPDGLLALIPLESSQRDAESIPSSVGFLRRSRMANWRMKLVEREGGRDPWLTAGSPIPEAPSNRPALPDLSQQGYLTAYTTRLVTSVVCRGFIPARGDIAIRQPAPRGFSLGAVASLLRCMARRPIRIQLRRAGQHRRVPARILT
ncbi:hypothetical protein AAWM_07365 [Aspergillus awamori]|uniref:Uncharacterized protein n=1 Tax=Aspergillus awamori TaxID=105351 RepID=A0A401KZ00_ASPAW|nr:hypothetical protein AAWM_07365 [Aspergillus awamori]